MGLHYHYCVYGELNISKNIQCLGKTQSRYLQNTGQARYIYVLCISLGYIPEFIFRELEKPRNHYKRYPDRDRI
jgi:hypothetical protein